jgi:hypothetical protein
VKSFIASFHSGFRDDRGSRDGRRASADGAMMYVWPGRAVQDGFPRTTNVKSCLKVSGLSSGALNFRPTWISARIRVLLAERPRWAIMAPSLMVAPGRPFVHLFIPSRRLWQGKLLILSYSV